MSWQAIVQLLSIGAALAVAAPLFGRYLARVYGVGATEAAPGDRLFAPVERAVYRMLRIDPRREQQRWNTYAVSLIAFSVMSFLVLYAILRLQGSLPFNPTERSGLAPNGAFNAAVSFVTNTNWQWFSGELAISHLTQMLGFTVQNFVSAAVGMAVAVALIRGISRTRQGTLGNFWVDVTRTIVRVLIPLALGVTVVLMSQGVVQNLRGDTLATPLDSSAHVSEQHIPGGPFASQEAIKVLGTNGGGPYNANSAHPFENPNGVTNAVQIFSMLLLPLALVFAFGRLVGDRRQARLLISVMAGLLLLFTAVTAAAEQNGNPLFDVLGVDQSLSTTQGGGNLEGKDVRIGAAGCAIYAGATTGTSTGAVNCMHDSLTPLGGAAPMTQMMLGEISPGGVGVGLMGVLVNALLAVFIAGLMVGRTPEYLGKKIQATEMKLLTLYILAMPFAVLTFAAAAVVIDSAATFQPGAHGLSEVLYNYASSGNNNGSAFAYQGTGTQWYTTTQGLSMLLGRFFTIIPALAIGGSLAAKPKVPETSGTMPTHTPLFGALLAGVIFVVAGLTFFPALTLGPILEHLSL